MNRDSLNSPTDGNGIKNSNRATGNMNMKFNGNKPSSYKPAKSGCGCNDTKSMKRDDQLQRLDRIVRNPPTQNIPASGQMNSTAASSTNNPYGRNNPPANYANILPMKK